MKSGLYRSCTTMGLVTCACDMCILYTNTCACDMYIYMLETERDVFKFEDTVVNLGVIEGKTVCVFFCPYVILDIILYMYIVLDIRFVYYFRYVYHLYKL